MRKTLALIFVGTFLAACGGKQEVAIQLAPETDLSPELREAPLDVQETYRFALANRELLEQIPCYCGCVGGGHTSNYDCYVASIGAQGNVTFDMHAFG